MGTPKQNPIVQATATVCVVVIAIKVAAVLPFALGIAGVVWGIMWLLDR
jgi:hypothetical protein